VPAVFRVRRHAWRRFVRHRTLVHVLPSEYAPMRGTAWLPAVGRVGVATPQS